MKNEPYGWVKNGEYVLYIEKPDSVFNYIPLYTHPAKEQDESFDRTASHMAGEYVSWTSCVACGQRVTSDSIHTCSPQLKEQDTECKYCKQGCFRCDARKQLTDEEIDAVGDKVSNLIDTYAGRREFARAILLKAQENGQTI